MSEIARLVRDTLTFLGHRGPAMPPPPPVIAAPPPPKKVERPPPPPPSTKPEPLRPIQNEPPPKESFSDVRRKVKERLPRLEVVDEIPDDAAARSIRDQWKSRCRLLEIVVVFHEETSQSRTFLANLAKAISLLVAPCDLVLAKRMEPLLLADKPPKLIVVADYALHGSPLLRRYLAEEGSKRWLGKTPLFLLSDLPLYFQSPKEKAALWSALRAAYAAL